MPQLPPKSESSAARKLAIVLGSLVLLAVAVRTAWLGDDAYITLRSVENWVSGNGLRWNPDDRVQTYTHPLWMLVLSFGRLLSGEVYFTTLTISMCLSMVAVLWLLLRCATTGAAVATGTMLLCSRAFVDYMTSGLETPLTFVLLVALVATVTGNRAPATRYSRAVLIATLLATNRMDLALLCLPAVLSTMNGVPFRVLWQRGLLMSLPFIAWLLFAGFYYGSPFPVTAHAKAFGVGIPSSELAEQGMRYLLHTLLHDPALLLITLTGSLLLLIRSRSRWLALGAMCYLGYVIKVGGGFMQGRFLLPPFMIVVACLGPWLSSLTRQKTQWLLMVIVALMFVGGRPSWMRSPASDLPLPKATIEAQHGIADERCMYYRELGLLSPQRSIPVFGSLTQLAFPEGRESRWWLLNGAVGAPGFGAGAQGHIVDPLLCDALIARLPARDPAHWRIGHVLRRIPEGYWESLASGENQIHHPGLRNYYEALRTLTQKPLFDGARLAMLWRMAIGSYDAGFQAFLTEQYYHPPRIEVAANEAATPLAVGTYWFDEPRTHLIYEGGIAVRFDEAIQARELQVQTFGVRAFRFRFAKTGQVIGEAMGVPQPSKPNLSPLQALAGIRVEQVIVPPQVPHFDTLWIDCIEIPGSDLSTGPPGIGAVMPKQ